VIELLAPLHADAAIWDDLAARFSLDVYCGVDVRLPNSGTELTAVAVAALAARRLTVQFDFYALPGGTNGSSDESGRLLPI
jgi:hypothetical protein